MNKKNIIVYVFFAVSLAVCSAKTVAPELNLILPTESAFMKLLDDESKKVLIEACKGELQKVEEKNIFEIKDLKDYFVYEEKVGRDEFIWFISPDYNKKDSLPDNQVFLLKKEGEVYKLLVKYDTRLIWGDLHLFLQFNNVMIIKGKDKAKGFVAFENRAQIYWKSNIIEDGYTIKQCKGQYVGKCNGTYYLFESKPALFEFEELFNVYKPDETEWEPIYIEASEFLWEEKNPLKYALCNAFDGNPETSYVENTEDDLMKIYIGIDGMFKQIKIINGYAKSRELYLNNNRVKAVASEFLVDKDDISDILTEKNKRFLLRDNVLAIQQVSYITNGYVFVADIYNGTKYNDTCIAELNLLTRNNATWLFGDTE